MALIVYRLDMSSVSFQVFLSLFKMSDEYCYTGRGRRISKDCEEAGVKKVQLD